ncbi:acyl-CoA dehydrogenase [Streptacidiphilus sp. ASG 303]|uniref:acyl-CoA dehydrogenase n=1 Tax=Streptacidiphilus sp. ASG 303 TaxID=2896847 RepID=UPI001E3838F7|nr:acyl-CoA dehydrogenase [Streptacidiphilus sp. ASG 303]MCD0486331.1 acyl-CoA dehydrogenase [Streptacidiphilus sp. ASG 303]
MSGRLAAPPGSGTAAAGAETAAETQAEAAAEAEVRRRVARWERRLGDPYDPANPAGFRTVLAAEERRELPGAAEELLADGGFGAELVPVGLGGRLDRADVLARVIRPVFRRDLGLGIGHGLGSLFAASPVWAAGSAGQRARLAALLCGGGRAAVVHHALAHGNALLAGEVSAVPDGGGFRLGGRKEVVINAVRAEALVVYARTGRVPGPGSHSVLLLEPGGPAGRGLRGLARQATPGLRGCHFSGLEFDGCRVSAEALVGEPGDGVRLALRSFQLHRPLGAASVVAAVDPVLRAAARAAAGSGGRPGRRRHGPLLAGVLADLLVCDILSVVVLRALHLLPDRVQLAAAEVKYLVPEMLREDLEELATVLDATGSRGELDRAVWAKLMRDLPTAWLGHAGTAACQSVVIPQLPWLARTSWFRGDEPPDGLFRPGAPLPDLDLGALNAGGGPDFLAAALVCAAGRLREGAAGGAYAEVLGRLAAAFVEELGELRRSCAAVEPGDLGALASARMCALADRHALLGAAGAALGFWERNRDGGGFLADPAWLVLALLRLGRRLSLAALPEPPAGCTERVLAEVLRRLREARGYDLYGEPVAGGSRS